MYQFLYLVVTSYLPGLLIAALMFAGFYWLISSCFLTTAKQFAKELGSSFRAQIPALKQEPRVEEVVDGEFSDVITEPTVQESATEPVWVDAVDSNVPAAPVQVLPTDPVIWDSTALKTNHQFLDDLSLKYNTDLSREIRSLPIELDNKYVGSVIITNVRGRKIARLKQFSNGQRVFTRLNVVNAPDDLIVKAALNEIKSAA